MKKRVFIFLATLLLVAATFAGRVEASSVTQKLKVSDYESEPLDVKETS